MANFILVSPSSGTGTITIKVKPTSENTSTTVEKKGKLIIRVNGEIQKTIPLTQTVKGSTGGGGGTTTRTLTSREISLDIYQGSYPDPSGLNRCNTNTEGIKSDQWYIRRSFYYTTSNKDNTISIPYSISAIQTDYFSDGTQEYTNLLPVFTWQLDKDDTGIMKNYWKYTSNIPELPGDTPVLAGYTISIESTKAIGLLRNINKIYANFGVVSKSRTDVEDTMDPIGITVDTYWTITVLDTTGTGPGVTPPVAPDH